MSKLDPDGAAGLMQALAHHEELARKRRERLRRRAEAVLAKAIREASGEPEGVNRTLWEQPQRDGQGGNPWRVWTCDGPHFIKPFYIYPLKEGALPRCPLCGRRLRRWHGPLPGMNEDGDEW